MVEAQTRKRAIEKHYINENLREQMQTNQVEKEHSKIREKSMDVQHLVNLQKQ